MLRAVGFVATEDMIAAGISRKILDVIDPLQLDPSLLIQAGDGHLSPSPTLPPNSMATRMDSATGSSLSFSLSLSHCTHSLTHSPRTHTRTHLIGNPRSVR